MLTYRVFTQAFIADEPELVQVYYEGPDLDTAREVFQRIDSYTLKLRRVKPYATLDALAAFFAFERYPGHWHLIPAETIDPEEVG